MGHKDNRYDAAAFYDRFCSPPPGDIDFYHALLTSPGARVLELGCGTGRVLVPLAAHCAYIHGVDLYPAMLAVAQQKLEGAAIPPDTAALQSGDITDLDLTGDHAPFDLVTAPFRVMQNLETDAQVDGLLNSIHRYLAPAGTAVLNAFRPRPGGADALRAFWSARDGRTPAWERVDGDTTVRLYEDCTRFADDASVVYPVLTYRRYSVQGRLIDEAALDIVMRVWRPDELLDRIAAHGFAVTGRFGGYEGEPWGQGPELVVAFTHASR